METIAHMFFFKKNSVLHLTIYILMLIKIYIANLLLKNVNLLFDAF